MDSHRLFTEVTCASVAQLPVIPGHLDHSSVVDIRVAQPIGIIVEALSAPRTLQRLEGTVSETQFLWVFGQRLAEVVQEY